VVKEKEIILVDKEDNEIGLGEKLDVHKKGKLHRAFSVFIFNSRGKLLLQKRAKKKYHSPGLWSNSCDGHPRPNKDIEKEAEKRLKEEMGFKSKLRKVTSFAYRGRVGGLIENEIDNILVGKFEGKPKPNKQEVEDVKWVAYDSLRKDIKNNPQNYTLWFRIIFDKVIRI
jgi:isopentenyl-diphosphate delta-isomerase